MFLLQRFLVSITFSQHYQNEKKFQARSTSNWDVALRHGVKGTRHVALRHGVKGARHVALRHGVKGARRFEIT